MISRPTLRDTSNKRPARRLPNGRVVSALMNCVRCRPPAARAQTAKVSRGAGACGVLVAAAAAARRCHRSFVLPLMLLPQVLAAVRAHSAELRFLFSQLDVSGDGVVDHAEFCTGLRALALVDRSVTDQQLQLAAGLLDTDGDGGISWEEFLQALGGAAPDVYDPAVVRRGSGSGDAAVVRRGSGSGDAAVVRRGSGSWDAAHPPTPKSAGPVPVAGKRCRRVSPEVGPCSLKALDYSDFCHLHTCPVCGKEKQSRAQGCARHPSGGRASLVPPQDPHAARSPRALASASPQGSPRHCLRVSPNGTCHLRPLDKSKYCHLHTCPVCGNEKVSSSKGCTQHPAGA